MHESFTRSQLSLQHEHLGAQLVPFPVAVTKYLTKATYLEENLFWSMS